MNDDNRGEIADAVQRPIEREIADAVQRPIEKSGAHAAFVLDAEGHIETWSEPARELYGYEPATVLDRPLGYLFAETDALDRPIETLLDEAETDTVQVSHWHRRADGSTFWATLSLSPLRDDGFRGYAAVCQDTTEQKQYGRMLERQNERLKEFTDILAHDLQVPLNVVSGHVELARETGDVDLDAIEETVDRMKRLVDDLLRVARQGDAVTDPEPTDVGEVIRDAWEGTGGAADGATLEYAEEGVVAADPDRLRQLFENLFRNAVEHGSTNSRPWADDTVERGEEHGATGGVAVRVGPLEDGFYVDDDGPGIPPGNRANVFDHGFTTTEEGTGYGLSVVRTIAGAHGWDVTVTDGETGGARFEVTGIEFVE